MSIARIIESAGFEADRHYLLALVFHFAESAASFCSIVG